MAMVAPRTESANPWSPDIQAFIRAGVWIPVAGILIGLAGRPILILAILPTCLATILFWFGTTIP